MEAVEEAIQKMLGRFTYKHLSERSPHLAEISKPFCDIAHSTAANHPHDMILLLALDDLMKAKDSIVRLGVKPVKEEE